MNGRLVPKRFKITNFRNIDDSGWIPLERVTAFVGRNESGKTALLKGLHKFNPASPEPYNAQKEFPRDRFTRDFVDGADWEVCAVDFELSEDFTAELRTLLETEIPKNVICTRYYDGSLDISYETDISTGVLEPSVLIEALNKFGKAARRLAPPNPEQEQQTQNIRIDLTQWATQKTEELADLEDLRTPEGVTILRKSRDEINAKSHPISADAIDELYDSINELLSEAELEPPSQTFYDKIEAELPVFIYFENYGILDSAVYLPRFLEDLKRQPHDPKARTINAMFKHVKLDPQDIHDLGREGAAEQRRSGHQVDPQTIRKDQEKKELRAVRLNSASLDITQRFSDWFHQRRHNIRYDADGDYFRIWISDDRRPGVEIELESRSKGFQWFFSFYLVFLVESEEGHKDAVLLLDEPGLHLHPTAQQELIDFFEELANNNMLLYSTHSPFLIDGDHIHRVRPVTEDETGHSTISVDSWPRDRETIFPLQAAAGYAMVRGLFQRKKNVLVEGMADYLYLHTLNLICIATGRESLPEEIYITPCGGTKYMGHISSLFLGQEVRPLVLLDGDDAGRARRDALMKSLYSGHERAVLMIGDVLGMPECEIEDLIGEEIVLPILSDIIGKKFVLSKADRSRGSLVDQITAAADRKAVSLPEGWKHEVARRFAVEWSTSDPDMLSQDVLDRTELLFEAIIERFEEGIEP